MPPKIRFDRDCIINAAYQLARKDGYEAINARAVAKEMGSSTQPLFRVFENMEKLKAEVYKKAQLCCQRYITDTRSGAWQPDQAAAMAYLLFAREEPQLFRLLFMRQRTAAEEEFRLDRSYDETIKTLMTTSGLTREQAERFYQHMCVFIHGLATMQATGLTVFTTEHLSDMLKEEYFAATVVYRRRASNG
ncbi:MAG: TetR/AcrR family transcriptional regulator [Clostridiales bacterium]|nr:TetR/AcrR family transcriptional regulator [Clostridiales bacterium]